MDLSMDETSAAARDLVRTVLARQAGGGGTGRGAGGAGGGGVGCAREAEPLGHDPKLWGELCAAGLPGLAVDDRHGGGGGDLLALVVAAGELGAVLAPVPWAEHTVAARLLAAAAPSTRTWPRSWRES